MLGSGWILALALIAGVSSKIEVPRYVAEAVLDTALEAQGISQNQIDDIILSPTSDNPKNLALKINTAIKSNLFDVQDGSFRLNIDQFRDVLGNTVEFSIKKWSQNPALGVALRPRIDDFIKFYSGDLQTLINKNSSEERQKRDTSLQITTRDTLLDAIGEGVGSLVESIGTAIGSLIEGVAVGSLPTIISSLGSLVAAIVQPITSLLSGLISILGSLLAFIINPLDFILGFIFAPLNQAIKLFVIGPIIENLECNLGHSILSPIKDLLNQLINTLIPCATCTNIQ